jgi:hypothetical protein
VLCGGGVQFPDVRAALAVALYAQGLTAEAETNWGRLEVTVLDVLSKCDDVVVCLVFAFRDWFRRVACEVM